MERVKLKDFLRITERVIDPQLCAVRDDDTCNVILPAFHDMDQLNPYLDYELVSFAQEFNYGELDIQIMRIRKIQEEK